MQDGSQCGADGSNTIGRAVCHACRKEPELTWIAKQAVQVPLPPHWQEHEDDSGNPYFYDTNTGKTFWRTAWNEFGFECFGRIPWTRVFSSAPPPWCLNPTV